MNAVARVPFYPNRGSGDSSGYSSQQYGSSQYGVSQHGASLHGSQGEYGSQSNSQKLQYISNIQNENWIKNCLRELKSLANQILSEQKAGFSTMEKEQNSDQIDLFIKGQEAANVLLATMSNDQKKLADKIELMIKELQALNVPRESTEQQLQLEIMKEKLSVLELKLGERALLEKKRRLSPSARESRRDHSPNPQESRHDHSPNPRESRRGRPPSPRENRRGHPPSLRERRCDHPPSPQESRRQDTEIKSPKQIKKKKKIKTSTNAGHLREKDVDGFDWFMT